jgi:hypothetical protein
MDLYAELIKIFDCLNKNKIDHALYGGIAVALYGYPRFNGDIDIMIKRDDITKIKKSFVDIDYSTPEGPFMFDTGTPKAREMYRTSGIIGSDVFTIEMMVVNEPLDEIWRTRGIIDIDGREITIVSRKSLIEMKKAAGGEQDLLDVENLKNNGIKNNRKKIETDMSPAALKRRLKVVSELYRMNGRIKTSQK